jgi:iron-sulfur cluster assembly protein
MESGTEMVGYRSPPTEDHPTIEITDRAASQIGKMLARRNRGETGLRVGVKAGGCSGFEYTFAWETGPRPNDNVFEARESHVFIDPKSIRLLDGIVLDYDTSLLSKGFVLNNPNATGTCGCGASFSVDRN